MCTGAVLLAEAGLLDDHRATTHWASADWFAGEYPAVDVDPDPIFVHDGRVWTSAGVTAGMDLALALVADDLGAQLAHEIASWLVMFTRRPGGQSQFSASLRTPPAQRSELADLQRWMVDHPGDDLTVGALAARVGMSSRHFARCFAAECGVTPARYVEDLRLERARHLLATTDLTVDAIAHVDRPVGRGGAAPAVPPPPRFHAHDLPPPLRPHLNRTRIRRSTPCRSPSPSIRSSPASMPSGPYQVLQHLPGAETVFVAERVG